MVAWPSGEARVCKTLYPGSIPGATSKHGVLGIFIYLLVYQNMKPRSWTKNDLKIAVKKSKSVRQVLFCLGLIPAGGNYTQIQKFLSLYNISTRHFTGRGWSKGLRGIGKPKIDLNDILVRNSSFQSFKLKKRLFNAKLKPQHCEECGWKKKSEDGRLPLELDHINGDSSDNRLENLRVLCPNCHSLKPTHRGRNRKR